MQAADGPAERAVQRGYDRYLAAFNDHDARAALAFVVTPLALVRGAELQLLETPIDVERWLTALLAGLAEQHFSHSIVRRHAVTLLTDSLALMQAEGDRLDTAGGVMGGFAALYTLARGADGEWRVAVLSL